MEYDKIQAIRSSDLDLIKSNPLLYMQGAKTTIQSPALSFGTLVHTLSLEPNKFIDEFAIEPKFNKRTKDGKAEYEKWLDANKDKTIITNDDFEKATELAEKIRAFLVHFSGAIEEIFVANWQHLKLKAKPDMLAEDNKALIDIKTISRVDISNDYLLAKAIRDRHYDRQLAFYKIVLNQLGIYPEYYYLIFASKDNNWVRGVKLRNEDIFLAYEEAVEILENYQDLLINGLKIKNLFTEIRLRYNL